MKKGGYRPGSGRKPKASELKLIELLTPLEPIALKALEKGLKKGDFVFVKLFMEYRYGKPKQQIDIKQPENLDIPVTHWVTSQQK